MTHLVTFSRSITIVPTHACANACGYCSFRRPSDGLLSLEDAVVTMRQGRSRGCREALIMSGERPWQTPGFHLSEFEYLDYIFELCLTALREGLLPHTNIGVLSFEQLARLRHVNASMGLMLETSAPDLAAHRGGKDIAGRIRHLESAGSLRIPFTTGILVGIGEARADRLDALRTIRDLHRRYGHIQEVIVQSFVPHPGTPMQSWPEPPAEETAWTVAEATRILGDIPVQVPPNLLPEVEPLLAAGARDLGGVSPERDEIVPERSWPSVEVLSRKVHSVGLSLQERIPVHPEVDADLAPAADTLRRELVGDAVTYVINRNINFTNVCAGACGFCAFRQPPGSKEGYLFSVEQVLQKAGEAEQVGATELCIQGGLHPEIGLDYYVRLLQALKSRFPGLHLHAFSPMEVYRISRMSGKDLVDVLSILRDSGLDSMPGTAAEILDDEVRRIICPDKLSTDEWVEVVRTAHRLGIRTTATMMFGHVETWRHRVRHLEVLLNVQREMGGFTELVLLPFTPGRTPLARQYGLAPITPQEVMKVTAYCRLYLGRDLPNIQNSWVKIGVEAAVQSLNCGASDFGGTLMEENISRCAGAGHGQCLSPEAIQEVIRQAGRIPVQRDTLYRTCGQEACDGTR